MTQIQSYFETLQHVRTATPEERLSEAVATADAWGNGPKSALGRFVKSESVRSESHRLNLVHEIQYEYTNITGEVYQATELFQSEESNALLRLLYYVQHIAIQPIALQNLFR